MVRFGRTLVGAIVFVGLGWVSFNVPLGDATFAEHVQRISRTPEAEALVEGTRSAVRPMLHEATERLVGEYVEAPTVPNPSTTPRQGGRPGPPLAPDTGLPDVAGHSDDRAAGPEARDETPNLRERLPRPPVSLDPHGRTAVDGATSTPVPGEIP